MSEDEKKGEWKPRTFSPDPVTNAILNVAAELHALRVEAQAMRDDEGGIADALREISGKLEDFDGHSVGQAVSECAAQLNNLLNAGG